MMGHMSFDPIIMLPRDAKPKRYIFWLHIVPSYYFRLFINKKLALQKKRYIGCFMDDEEQQSQLM
jgi:hypothetical protein